MAAFCGCCGAEITLRAQACPVCGTPRHGMAQTASLFTLDQAPLPFEDEVRSAERPRLAFTCRCD